MSLVGKQPIKIIPDNAMLTTVDNPYNPHTDWDSWYRWDTEHGYYTTTYLARHANFDVDVPDWVQNQLIDEAIIRILNNDVLNIYTLVFDDSNEGESIE